MQPAVPIGWHLARLGKLRIRSPSAPARRAGRRRVSAHNSDCRTRLRRRDRPLRQVKSRVPQVLPPHQLKISLNKLIFAGPFWPSARIDLAAPQRECPDERDPMQRCNSHECGIALSSPPGGARNADNPLLSTPRAFHHYRIKIQPRSGLGPQTSGQVVHTTRCCVGCLCHHNIYSESDDDSLKSS